MLSTIQLFSLRNTACSSLLLSRSASWKTELKIKWVRPEKISCIKPEKSGDLSSFENPDQKRFRFNFEKSEELKSADEMVKNLFTLENSNRVESVYIYNQEMVDLVQRHDLDNNSMEARIAKMTGKIRALQAHMEEFPRNAPNKIVLKELIEKRKKFLKYLRRWDYRRFEWLLEKLDLKYTPYPEHFHWVTRKESLRKLTNLHCEKIKQDRLDTYRKELEAKQLTFLEDKIKNLEFIRKEQAECKVPVTVAADQINEVKKQFKELKVKREEEAKLNQQKSEKEDYELKL